MFSLEIFFRLRITELGLCWIVSKVQKVGPVWVGSKYVQVLASEGRVVEFCEWRERRNCGSVWIIYEKGFCPFIRRNCGPPSRAGLARRLGAGVSWTTPRINTRRPASHWPLLLGAVENRPRDDGEGGDSRGELGAQRTFLPSNLPFFRLRTSLHLFHNLLSTITEKRKKIYNFFYKNNFLQE